MRAFVICVTLNLGLIARQLEFQERQMQSCQDGECFGDRNNFVFSLSAYATNHGPIPGSRLEVCKASRQTQLLRRDATGGINEYGREYL